MLRIRKKIPLPCFAATTKRRPLLGVPQAAAGTHDVGWVTSSSSGCSAYVSSICATYILMSCTRLGSCPRLSVKKFRLRSSAHHNGNWDGQQTGPGMNYRYPNRSSLEQTSLHFSPLILFFDKSRKQLLLGKLPLQVASPKCLVILPVH